MVGDYMVEVKCNLCGKSLKRERRFVNDLHYKSYCNLGEYHEYRRTHIDEFRHNAACGHIKLRVKESSPLMQLDQKLRVIETEHYLNECDYNINTAKTPEEREMWVKIKEGYLQAKNDRRKFDMTRQMN